MKKSAILVSVFVFTSLVATAQVSHSPHAVKQGTSGTHARLYCDFGEDPANVGTFVGQVGFGFDLASPADHAVFNFTLLDMDADCHATTVTLNPDGTVDQESGPSNIVHYDSPIQAPLVPPVLLL